jgi:hypothetical protein
LSGVAQDLFGESGLAHLPGAGQESHFPVFEKDRFDEPFGRRSAHGDSLELTLKKSRLF